MNGRWETSAKRFRDILARDDVPADLQARCRRALARTLVNEAQWVQAIKLHRQALAAFQRLKNPGEAAGTMTDIGYAYLDMALNTWGGGEPIPVQPPSRFQVLSDLAGWFTRLPLVCFLMFQMGPRPLLPVLHRVGRGMDWVIARLLGTAAVWFRRAESRLNALDDQAGLAAVREQQVRLYLALNHPGEAEEISRRLVQTEGTSLGQYRAARAWLGLAEALLRQLKAKEACLHLEEALPVFIGCAHHKRIAETYTMQAQAAIIQGDFDAAVHRYCAALAAWRDAGDPKAITEAAEQAATLAQRPTLAPEAQALLCSASEQVTERRYPTRYMHPLVEGFQLAALIALAIVFFFTLFLAIRTQSGTEVGASAALMTPQYVTAGDEFTPRAELTIEQQTSPTFNVQVAGFVMLWSAVGYLAVYALLGLYLIVRAPLLTIQRKQSPDVVVDPRGIGLVGGQGGTRRLDWDEVRSVAISDRRMFRHPIEAMSGMAVSGESTHLHISGLTRHYSELQRLIRAAW